MAVVVVACTGKDKGEPFDRTALAKGFCAAGCQLQVDCAPLPPPQTFFDDCNLACEAGLQAGTVNVGPDCPMAGNMLLGCVQGLSCEDVTSGNPYCTTEAQAYADACQPLGTDPCVADRSRGPSEPCCPDFGSEACESGLFCVPFDAGGPAVCSTERSRAGGLACGADVHCVSGSCHLEVGLCRAGLGQTCTPQAGCQDQRALCSTQDGGALECKVFEGKPGDPCRSDDGCAWAGSPFDLECTASVGIELGTCVERLSSGAPCTGTELACSSKMRCAEICDSATNVCRPGFRGERCSRDEQCGSGVCTASACTGVARDEPCNYGCSQECAYRLVCRDNVCGGPGPGDPCQNTAECTDNLACISGRCASNRACIPLEYDCPRGEGCVWYGGADLRCAAAGSGGVGVACSVAEPCRPSLVCMNFGDGPVCHLPCLFGDECAEGDRCWQVIDSDGVDLGFALCQ